MPPPETGRQRAIRIPLDYHKHPTRLDWGRGWWALVIAAVLALGGVAVAWAMSGSRGTSRGPVAAVHATWDNDCAACHESFLPASDEAWATHLTSVAAMNQKCEGCHKGPAHHDSATPALACAACHHEHAGRDASLVRMPDSACTQCHADLKAHHTGTESHFDNSVTAFAAHHPEFKVLREKSADPGRLKFNHKLHMSPGMATDKGDPNWTLERIPPQDRERYRQPGQKDDKARVTLTCGSCHRTDSGDFDIKPDQLAGLPVDAVLPVRTAGAYMLPIIYENQCRACHPLTFEHRDAGDLAVPHRLQPPQVREFLEGHYTAEFLRGNSKLFERFVPTRPLPGQLLPKDEAEQARRQIDRKVDAAEKILSSGKTTCAECHYYEAGQDGAARQRIVPPRVPQVWFEHAKFDHAAHRAVECRDCHARAYADDANASVKETDVLLPGIETCAKCHAPRSGSGTGARGGARFDCAECHNYHNGRHPLQGLGAEERGARARVGIGEFLSGGLGARGASPP
jgi:hypothetical protein